jgi:hypothetical protein
MRAGLTADDVTFACASPLRDWLEELAHEKADAAWKIHT